jgi:hypothetical protein
MERHKANMQKKVVKRQRMSQQWVRCGGFYEDT